MRLDTVKELKKRGYTDKDLKGKYKLIADVLNIGINFLQEGREYQ